MDDTAFDKALIAAGFEQIATRGWHRFSVAEAAVAAGLPLDRARTRFGGRAKFLIRFGRMLDAAALAGDQEPGSVRDRLFDMLMRRIDVMQAHRAGAVALLRALPTDPIASLFLGRASLASMGWMLAAVGVDTHGPLGRLRRKGLLGVWLWTLRAWQRDDTTDLAPTMAALDHALVQADKAAGWLQGRRASDAAPDPDHTPATA
jgi:hypothetical protein